MFYTSYFDSCIFTDDVAIDTNIIFPTGVAIIIFAANSDADGASAPAASAIQQENIIFFYLHMLQLMGVTVLSPLLKSLSCWIVQLLHRVQLLQLLLQ